MGRIDIYLRRLALGLMLLLSVAASSWGDSYDPNPFDDIPPVVTIELNYLKPQIITQQVAQDHSTAPVMNFLATVELPAIRSLGAPSVGVITDFQRRESVPLFAPLRT